MFVSKLRIVAGLSYSDCCTTTPSKAMLISYGLGGRPLQVESYLSCAASIAATSLSLLLVEFCFPSGWTTSVGWYPTNSIVQYLGFSTTPGRLDYSPCQFFLYNGWRNCMHAWEEFVFRFRKLDIPVCTSNVSALANKLYLKNQVSESNYSLLSLNRIWCVWQGQHSLVPQMTWK